MSCTAFEEQSGKVTQRCLLRACNGEVSLRSEGRRRTRRRFVCGLLFVLQANRTRVGSVCPSFVPGEVLLG